MLYTVRSKTCLLALDSSLAMLIRFVTMKNNGDKFYHRKYMHTGDEKQKLGLNVLVQASHKLVSEADPRSLPRAGVWLRD